MRERPAHRPPKDRMAIHPVGGIGPRRRSRPLGRTALLTALVLVLGIGGLPMVASAAGAVPPGAPGPSHFGAILLAPHSLGKSVPGVGEAVQNGTRATPSWPTFLANDARTSADAGETALNVSNVANLSERWTRHINGSVFSSEAYVNGTVYFGAWNGYEYAVDAVTGSVDWATYLGHSSTCYVGGIDSSPTVWNNTLYVGAPNDHWDALNITTGAIEWRVDVFTTGNFDWASPLVYDGALYIGLASCSDSPLVQGKLLEVNLSGTHSILHEFDTVPNGTIGSTIWATPVLDRANRTIWVATGNDNGIHQKYAQSLVALNATTLAVRGFWQVPNVVGQDQDFGATPTLIHDATGRELIVDTNKNGYAYALNASNVTSNGSWKPVWKLWLGNGPLYAPAAFDGTTLYEAGSNVTLGGTYYGSSLRAVDPATGKAIWTQGSNLGTIYGAPVYSDGFVIDTTQGGSLEVRNASDGNLLATYPLPIASGYSAAAEGSPIVVDGQIICGDGDAGGSSIGSVVDFGVPLGRATLTAPPSGRDAPYDANFSASVGGGIPPYNFAWDFGDGSQGAGGSVSHVYTMAGTFDVTVNVTDLTGQEELLNTTVVVYPSLTTGITGGPFGPHIFPLVVGFTALPTGGSGAPYNLTWDFGDGSATATGSQVGHEYDFPGTYRATLTTEDSTGATAFAAVNITVVRPLELTLAISGAATGEAPFEANFTATMQFGGSPVGLLWTFGDGTGQSGGLSASHTYGAAGTYHVSLVGSDTAGDHVVRSVNVTVSAALQSPLIAATQLSTSCSPPGTSEELNFTTAGGVGPFTGTWEFGDGTTGAAVNVTHFYATNGTFVVNLTLTDALGRTSNTSETIAVTGPYCTPSHGPPTHTPSPTSSPAGPTVEEYALIGAALAAVAIGVAVLWARRGRHPR